MSVHYDSNNPAYKILKDWEDANWSPSSAWKKLIGDLEDVQ